MDGFDIEDKSTVGTAALATQRNDGRTRWIANVGRSTCHGTTNNTGNDSRAEDISSTGNCGGNYWALWYRNGLFCVEWYVKSYHAAARQEDHNCPRLIAGTKQMRIYDLGRDVL